MDIKWELKDIWDLFHKWTEMGFASEQYWGGGEAEAPEKTTGYELRTAEAGWWVCRLHYSISTFTLKISLYKRIVIYPARSELPKLLRTNIPIYEVCMPQHTYLGHLLPKVETI